MSLFPVFLDDASAGLKEVSGCIGLKCSFKSPFYIREWRKGLIKQSGTWKVIWMQLVISLNLCVFIMLRKHNYLGHFVLWRFTSHALTPNPKGCGPWLGSAVLDCFLPLVNGLENSALRGVSEGEEDEWDCKQKSERERDRERDGVRLGKSHFLIGLPLILKVFCDFFFFGRSNNWICCRVLGPTGQSCPLGAHPLLETPFLAQLPLDGLWEHHLSLLTLQPKEVSSWWWHLPGLLILKKSGHPLFGFSAFPSSM